MTILRNIYATARLWLAQPLTAKRVPHIDGVQAAEKVAAIVGSWRFVIWQNAAVVAWIVFNAVALLGFHADPYPFILLNLMFSWQASNTGPILQMTGNAGALRDRAQMARIEQVENTLAALLAENTALTQQIHAMLSAQGQTTAA